MGPSAFRSASDALTPLGVRRSRRPPDRTRSPVSRRGARRARGHSELDVGSLRRPTAGRRFRSVALTVTVIATCAAIFGLAAPAANAGTQGQQIQLFAPSQQSVRICGWNQPDQHHISHYVCHVWNTQGYYNSYQLRGWWWHGTVQVQNFADTGAAWWLGNTSCSVPVSQHGDWTTCNGARRRGNVKRFENHFEVPPYFLIYLDHNGAQAAWRSVAAAGNFSNLGKIPVIGLGNFGNVVSNALSAVTNIATFINNVKANDHGYGVVIYVSYFAPFLPFGKTLAVTGQ
jgi:hypothetical protein